jgi:hypothetical protein
MSPMYMAGLLRTASSPSRTWIFSAEYWFEDDGIIGVWWGAKEESKSRISACGIA